MEIRWNPPNKKYPAPPLSVFYPHDIRLRNGVRHMGFISDAPKKLAAQVQMSSMTMARLPIEQVDKSKINTLEFK